MVGVRMFVDEGPWPFVVRHRARRWYGRDLHPPRFPTEHLAAARSSGLSTRWMIDTHSHADYVTGSPSLAVDPGITFIAPAASKLETPHQSVRDEELIDLAEGVTGGAIVMPGHTPDHHAYLIESDGVTGGAVHRRFVDGWRGRADQLRGRILAEPLAHEMFHSLRRLDGLPDDLAVYPTHGAGSFCSAPGGTDRTTTLGHERASNHLSSLDNESRFVEQLLVGFGTFRRTSPGSPAEPPRSTLVSVDPSTSGSTSTPSSGMSWPAWLIVDARPIAEYSAGHSPVGLQRAAPGLRRAGSVGSPTWPGPS